MRATLRLLAFPAVFVLGLTLFNLQLGQLALYGFAAVFGLMVLASLRDGPEGLLAVTIIYLPLNRLYAADLAPKLNGTNVLELLMIAAWIGGAVKGQRTLFTRRPFTRMVTVWAILSLLSVFTAIAHVGFNEFIWNYTVSLRGFVDQFILFFLFVNLIRDKNMARRVVVYMMIAATISYLYGFREWFDTRGYTSIEKSRLLGPVGQPNEYAAFIIYTIAPLLAFAAYYFPRWKSLRLAPVLLRLAPVLLIALRVLMGTFSRAAYIALAAEAVGVSWFRSKRLFALLMVALTSVYFFVPSLIPNSMQARVAQTHQDKTAGGNYDRSSEERLLLWGAAVRMTEESPIFGQGYGQFPRLAEDYVSSPTKATDNQNMYLYVSSDMGLPALASLLIIIAAFALRGRRLFRRATLDIDRIIGLGAVTMVCGLLVVNMFGTHMIDSAIDGFFWIYAAVLAHLCVPSASANAEKTRPTPLPFTQPAADAEPTTTSAANRRHTTVA